MRIEKCLLKRTWSCLGYEPSKLDSQIYGGLFFVSSISNFFIYKGTPKREKRTMFIVNLCMEEDEISQGK